MYPVRKASPDQPLKLMQPAFYHYWMSIHLCSSILVRVLTSRVSVKHALSIQASSLWSLPVRGMEDEVSSIVRFCARNASSIHSLRRSQYCGVPAWSKTAWSSISGAIDHVHVAADRASARAGGGITSGTLNKHLDELSLATPAGFCTTVGYAGWSLEADTVFFSVSTVLAAIKSKPLGS